MTRRAVRRRMSQVGPAGGARLARAAALGVLVVAGAALSGCSLKVLGHRMGLPVGAPKMEASGEPKDIPAARAGIATHPGEPYWPYRLGQLYVGADSLQAAEAVLQSALSLDPGYAPALALLSKLYFESGRYQEAVQMLEPVRSNPDAYPSEVRQVLLAGLALHQDALGRPDLAGATIARAPAPDLKRAGPAMVYLRLRGDHPDSAAGLASETLREDPRSAVNLNNYGITRLRAADPQAARRAFLQAIERDPALPGPYYNLAILEKYYVLDDAAASGWFRDYWKRSHEDPDSLLGVFAADPPKNVAQKGPDR